VKGTTADFFEFTLYLRMFALSHETTQRGVMALQHFYDTTKDIFS